MSVGPLQIETPAERAPASPKTIRRISLKHRLAGPLLLCSTACALAQAPAAVASPQLLAELPEAPLPQTLAQPSASPAERLATLTGSVLDRDSALLPGARITLTPGSAPALAATGATHPAARLATSDSNGAFTFPSLVPGPYTLTVGAPGFTTQATTLILHPGDSTALPPMTLHPGTESEIEVTLTTQEIAEDQIHVQEQQRIFGALPNYYVSYLHDAAPLTPRQKFELAWRSTFDPVTIAIAAAVAGVQQGNDDFPGYHQGAAGYGKRFGAVYGDNITGIFLGNFVLATAFRQDPRYFIKGTGSIRSRTLYAIAMSVTARGDNGRWQPNYSGILGTLAAAGISDAYYPSEDRDGAATIFTNTAIGTASSAVVNIFQEFLVRKLTPAARKRTPVLTPDTAPATTQPKPQPAPATFLNSTKP